MQRFWKIRLVLSPAKTKPAKLAGLAGLKAFDIP
jgi:hypothetical protein